MFSLTSPSAGFVYLYFYFYISTIHLINHCIYLPFIYHYLNHYLPFGYHYLYHISTFYLPLSLPTFLAYLYLTCPRTAGTVLSVLMLSGHHTKIMCPNCTPNWYALYLTCPSTAGTVLSVLSSLFLFSSSSFNFLSSLIKMHICSIHHFEYWYWAK